MSRPAPDGAEVGTATRELLTTPERATTPRIRRPVRGGMPAFATPPRVPFARGELHPWLQPPAPIGAASTVMGPPVHHTLLVTLVVPTWQKHPAAATLHGRVVTSRTDREAIHRRPVLAPHDRPFDFAGRCVPGAMTH